MWSSILSIITLCLSAAYVLATVNYSTRLDVRESRSIVLDDPHTNTTSLATPLSTTSSSSSSTTTAAMSAPCSSSQWRCASDGMCIDETYRCDNYPHCSDASDEFQCNYCPEDRFFKCQNGECVSKFFKCDGHPDCEDKSDELDCWSKDSCGYDLFKCADNSICIPSLWKCDGAADCLDHSDEEACPPRPGCDEDQYRCHNQVCISIDYVCDGERDCKDGEDEVHCEISRCKENPNHYMCKDGTCLDSRKVCDDRIDCSDGSDEGGLCKRECKVGDCSGECYNTPGGPHCKCSQGYQHLTDKVCVDIDECTTGNVSVCDHFCENLQGGYKCSCAEKYNLAEDNTTCKSGIFGYGFILVAMNRDIRMLYLDDTYYESIVSGSDLIQSVAYDPVENKVYWSNSAIIYRKGLIISDMPESIVFKGISRVESLGVDWYGRNLYIADSGVRKIIVCSLDGRFCGVIVENVSPRSLRLDIENGLLFWTDTKLLAIMKAGMDGTHQVELIKGGLKIPNGLALDQPAKRVYWMDAGHSSIESVSYDGTDRKSLPKGVVSHPYSVDIWESRLFWTDLNHEHVRSCLKTNGKDVQTVLKGPSTNDFYGLTLYHSNMFNQVNNPCSGGQCSHLCLISVSKKAGYVCACPLGMKLTDMHSCETEDHLVYPYLVDGNIFYELFNPEIGRMILQRRFPYLKVSRVGDFIYDPVERSVIVSDVYTKNLLRVPLESGQVRHLVDNVEAVGISFDWLRQNVYWVDGVKKVVEVVSAVGLHRNVVGERYFNPTDIAVAPVQGFMFVTDASLVPYIKRCGLDGRDCKRIIAEDLYKPIAIVVSKDPETRRIYWCDKEEGVIETADMDGHRRIVLEKNLNNPISLLVSKEILMWTTEGSESLFVSSKKTNDSRNYFLTLTDHDYGMRVLRLADVGWKIKNNATAKYCQHNGGCSQLCLGNHTHNEVCACGLGYQLNTDGKSCNPTTCPNNHFSCTTSKECIFNSWRCDGTADCKDGSDEENCTQQHRVCHPDEFMCTSGNCITKQWVCDGHKDCLDGSDEDRPDCKNRTCPANNFECKSGQCVPIMWKCDGNKECDDGSDEDDCPSVCPDHKFTCDDGKCIPDVWNCDGSEDCLDGSDELNCTDDSKNKVSMVTDGSTSTWTCSDEEMACELPEGYGCVPESSRCDGVADCLNKEDEEDCDCEEDKFKCLYTDRCIPLVWKCNGVPDCRDSSDEKDCPDNLKPAVKAELSTALVPPNKNDDTYCPEKQFACNNGQCIKDTLVCNGEADCSDGSDEWNYCSEHCNINNGGCLHQCRSIPNGVACSCYAGFHLDVDGLNCLDDKECDDEETCSHYCIELKGSYVCSCMEGYELEPDGRTCKLSNGMEWALVAGSDGVLLNLTSKLNFVSSIPVLSNFTSIVSLDYNPSSHSFIYANEDGYIMTMASESEKIETGTEIIRHCSNPNGISVDSIANNFYFSEYFLNPPSFASEEVKRFERDVKKSEVYSIINMCSLKNYMCTQVYRKFNVKIPSTKVSPVDERFFYCVNHQSRENQGKIVTSNLDGSSPSVLYQEKVVQCGALALDLPKKRVYWTDVILNSIQSINWNGKDYRLAIELQVHHPVGLTVMGEQLLWYNKKGRKMVRCHKYQGICNRKLIRYSARDAADKFEGRALISSSLFGIKVSDPCLEKNCSQMCTRVQGEAVCRCNVGNKISPRNPVLCVKEETCPGKPCAVGICEPLSKDRFVCRCPDGYSGTFCEVSRDVLQQSNNAGTAIAVTLVLIALVVVVAVVMWYRRQTFIIWRSKSRRSNQTYRFSNPGFGVMTSNPPFGVMTDTTSVSSKSSSVPRGGEMPRYVNCHEVDGGNENQFTTVNVPIQDDTSVDSAVVSTDSASFNAAFNKVDLNSPIPPIPPPSYLEEKKDWHLSPYNPQNDQK